MTGLLRRNKQPAEEKESTEALDILMEAGSEVEDEDQDEEADGGAVTSMVIHEFVAALIRLAWCSHPSSEAGVGQRLQVISR